jgi:hypothetical protein
LRIDAIEVFWRVRPAECGCREDSMVFSVFASCVAVKGIPWWRKCSYISEYGNIDPALAQMFVLGFITRTYIVEILL